MKRGWSALWVWGWAVVVGAAGVDINEALPLHREESAAAAPAPAAAAATAPAGGWIADHLSVGTRSTYYWLQDDHRSMSDTFIGNISDLDAAQDLAPWKVYIDYDFNRYAGLELTWDQVEADIVNGVGTKSTDGTIHMGGPILTLVGRWPNASAFTPFLGAGAAFWNASFDHSAWWKYGYANEEAYADSGRVNEPRNGKTRNMTFEDNIGFVATAGVDCRVGRHWSADLYLRYIDISTEDTYTLNAPGHDPDVTRATFPLDHLAAGLGVSYHF